ncbi:MAG: hypothetical protein NZ805_14700 [Armatimonadetes bacterium]|nr:hypothetical protein [Armatimonadota bacterium]MDW8029521.1 hypothetical protein [Armatimonadota bacterium]
MKRLTPLPFKTNDGEIVNPNWRKYVANVFVFLHDGHCFACKRVCHNFYEWQKEFDEWGAKVWLVWRGDFVPDGCQGFLENAKVRQKWLESDAAGILIVDRNGLMVKRWLASSGKGFPSPKEVLNAVKEIAIQCPE